jgi:1-acyl-sn-glycerol-3-phosphate acyltransferase
MPRVKSSLKKLWTIEQAFQSAAIGCAQLYSLKIRGKLTPEKVRAIYQPWSRSLIESLGGRLKLEGVEALKEPCLFVGNHMSYLDIPLLWALTECNFVSKEEVKYWPIIGMAAMVTGTIFVKRESKESRAQVPQQIADAIIKEKKKVAIFPEGSSSLEGKIWRYGAFRIAEQFQIPVQPFRLFYKPSRDAAYIDDDTLLPQIWKLLSHESFEARLKFFEPVKITNVENDCQKIQDMIQKDQRECLKEESLQNK